MLLNKLVPLCCIFLAGVNFATCLTHLNPSLHHSLLTKGTANILISFKQGTRDALDSVLKTSHDHSRTAKISALAHALQLNADSAQAPVLKFLHLESSAKESQLQFESFWISNQIFVQNVNLRTVRALMTFEEINEVHEEEFWNLDMSIERNPSYLGNPGSPEWNVAQIQAPEVWALGYLGQGVVVGNIDTGVLYNHSALRDNYIGEYGWYDPYSETELPNDQNGHGTHTMGVMVGSGGIGVAPGAKWMSCKGCIYDLCSSAHLIKCGQFMFCPTRPDFTASDCSKAPHVINCSWGNGRGNQAYNPVIDAWTAAGITPVFSNGNTGPECNGARSPGDHALVIGVGATTDTGHLAEFSGLGPTLANGIKPDFVAPGLGIRSATKSGVDDYAVMKGTSMACPHVAGTVALIKSFQPDIQFNDIYKLLLLGADRRELIPPGKNCGGIPESDFPNHAVGHGRVNAFNALKLLIGS